MTMPRTHARTRWLALPIAGLLLQLPAHAQDDGAGQALGTPIAIERLDGLRGGFELPSGLQVSFGFERVVWLNGALVATTRVDIPDIGAITPEQAQALAAARQTTLLQVGEGNTFDASATGGGLVGGLVIQNTLDGQDIRALTTLDVGTGMLGHFQELNAQAALQDALTRAGAP